MMGCSGGGTGGRIGRGRVPWRYAYGPLACISEQLLQCICSLITPAVNGNDCIPTLSFRVIGGFRNVAVVFNTDTPGAKAQIRSRILQGLTSCDVSGIMGDKDDWACSVVRTYLVSTLSENLAPPGEVYRAQGEWVIIENEDRRWNSGMIWTVGRELKIGRVRMLRGGLAKWGSAGCVWGS